MTDFHHLSVLPIYAKRVKTVFNIRNNPQYKKNEKDFIYNSYNL